MVNMAQDATFEADAVGYPELSDLAATTTLKLLPARLHAENKI
jgi:hypothetical protein